ncbi:MAG: TRAP transporter small permease [Lachnospiraceae bacterium]|nr:TRAP transporter small permease [Lachnospiraceae bacterium]MEE3461736.1 TRAP transporter small permease [Lachnospiraceae bacterium]
MKAFKKIMDWVARFEELLLVLAMSVVLVLTVGNVFSRFVVHQSWSFTEEIVVALFVLITMLAAALCCRSGELVSLSLLTDHFKGNGKKISVIIVTLAVVLFACVLFFTGIDKVHTQLINGKRTFVLNWPDWIFWSFIPIGAFFMCLHSIEYCVLYLGGAIKGTNVTPEIADAIEDAEEKALEEAEEEAEEEAGKKAEEEAEDRAEDKKADADSKAGASDDADSSSESKTEALDKADSDKTVSDEASDNDEEKQADADLRDAEKKSSGKASGPSAENKKKNKNRDKNKDKKGGKE